jgi:hypothetical protein
MSISKLLEEPYTSSVSWLSLKQIILPDNYVATMLPRSLIDCYCRIKLVVKQSTGKIAVIKLCNGRLVCLFERAS